MSKDPKVGTGKKPKGSGRRLYTDENPKDTVSVEFSSAAAIRRTLAKKSFKSKSHKRQSQIINLIHQRVRAAYKNAKDPDTKKRLKRALDYAEERKEASKRKTQRMKKEEIDMDLLTTIIMEELQATLDEKKRKRKKKRRRKRKLRKKPSSETSLRDWFKRKGAPGKKGGWVDCNAPRYKDGKKVGYKPCGRQKGEKRSKYPACRPTAAACKSRGKGKKWGKKAAKGKVNEAVLEGIIREELQRTLFKPGLMHHVENRIPVSENVYRPGSPCYFNVIKQARDFYRMGLYEVINEEERDLLENTELGEWVVIEGERIPLGFPMFEDESLDEAKKKKKKDPPIGKPTRNTGSGKKYKVFVRNPKTGKIKKITYGDAKGGLKGGWNDPEARKSFAARHQCAKKTDRTKAGYWACRAHKDFGPGIGRFW